MMLTISTTHQPATDLDFLLSKHPEKCQSFHLNFGTAHVFYPVADEARCAATLLVEVDPIALVRGPNKGPGTLAHYVNDRPYVASSFLSVAIAQVFGSALNGRSRERQALADEAIHLTAEVPVVPCRGGESLLRALFEPLGYDITAKRLELDPHFPAWGSSRYFSLKLEGRARLRDLLSQLYVLLPVLDDTKHYYVGEDEIAKLVRKGGGWLAEHPRRQQIAERYLRHQPRLVQAALSQLVAEEEGDMQAADEAKQREEARLEKKLSLHDQRIKAVVSTLCEHRVSTVIDLGCGEGRLLRALLAEKSIRRVAGADVSHAALENAVRLQADGDRVVGPLPRLGLG